MERNRQVSTSTVEPSAAKQILTFGNVAPEANAITLSKSRPYTVYHIHHMPNTAVASRSRQECLVNCPQCHQYYIVLPASIPGCLASTPTAVTTERCSWASRVAPSCHSQGGLRDMTCWVTSGLVSGWLSLTTAACLALCTYGA